MILPELPEALIVRRSAHGYAHSFTALQMDKYGRDCAKAALDHAASQLETIDFSVFRDDPTLIPYLLNVVTSISTALRSLK